MRFTHLTARPSHRLTVSPVLRREPAPQNAPDTEPRAVGAQVDLGVVDAARIFRE